MPIWAVVVLAVPGTEQGQGFCAKILFLPVYTWHFCSSDLPISLFKSEILVSALKVRSITTLFLSCWLQVLVPLRTTDTHIEENHHLPNYLPEDESPEKETDRAVSRTAAKQDNSGSWLNSAASFLTKTFYW